VSLRRDDDKGTSVVFHQPETTEEIEAMEEALLSCPSDSIGRDEPSEPSALTTAPPSEI
jgi:hypothetical protein